MERLYLHIGLMKTGTTYLQQVWRTNADALAEQGIWTPAKPDEPRVRLAVWDLVGRRPRGASDARIAGQWEKLTKAVASRSDHRVLLSEEYLAARTRREATRAVSGFPEHEVHVIVTARDLGRVLASAWQEDVKSGSTRTWSDFIAAVRDPARAAQDPGRGFWLRHDLPRVLAVWAAAAGRDRVHVVTVPPTGSPATLLLERMAAVIGFGTAPLTKPPGYRNESLGAPTTEVIRRLNTAIDGRLNQRQYDFVIKRNLITGLPPATSVDHLALPEDHLAWAGQEAERIIAQVREGGYDVVGDLEDLVPKAAERGRRPDEATDGELLEASLQALSVLAERAANAWWFKRRPDKPQADGASRLARASSVSRGLGYRLRRSGAELANRNQVATAAMSVYLRLRQRTSPADSGQAR
jgi:hypothetical protein